MPSRLEDQIRSKAKDFLQDLTEYIDASNYNKLANVDMWKKVRNAIQDIFDKEYDVKVTQWRKARYGEDLDRKAKAIVDQALQNK